MAIRAALAAVTVGWLATSAPTAATVEVAIEAARNTTEYRAIASTAQSAAEAEGALALDRPSRRLIQQGLQNEGFDPGAPDGLFGPRTRGAIRAWQAARGEAATGYLNGAQADLLRASAAGAAVPVAAEDGAEPTAEPPVPLFPGDTPEASPPSGDATAGPAPAPERCDEWNTEAYFEAATVEDVTACLAAGADVAALTEREEKTPLHLAAEFSMNPGVVEALVAAGADLEARKRGDHTPLHWAAAFSENPAVIEALLAAGADVNAPLYDGGTVLYMAGLWNENAAVMGTLLAAGADASARLEDGRTVLHHAARNENPAVIEALLAAGADVNALMNDGRTVLHFAAGGTPR